MLYHIFGGLAAQRVENKSTVMLLKRISIGYEKLQDGNDQQNQFTLEIIYTKGKHHNETHKHCMHCLSDI